ncbi:MAG: ABC transporter substrate-binding protein [Actinomycetes bacterium]
MKLRKKLAVVGVATALVAGVVLVAPAQAASKDLVVGITLDIDKLDPQGATSFSTVRALGLVYGSLVEVGPKLQIRPGLATSWGFNATGTQLRLHLRKGVKFQDGTPFDAQDVKASLERILDPASKAAARANIATIKSITASGLDVTLNLTIPNVPILAALDGVNMAMLSKKDIAAGNIGKTVNGTGPFKYVSWDAGQSVKLIKNPTYWGGAPKLDSVTFRVIPTEASILSALNAGTVQFAVITSPLVAKQVGSNLTMYKTPGLAYMALQINARQAPFNNLNVRLALQCAISRAEVIKTAASGDGSVIGPITSPAYKSDPKARPCPEADIAKAKAYLTAGGYPNGLTIKTMVAPTQQATIAGIGQSLKSQLAKAGITMELDVVDDSTYVSRWLAADFGTAIANNGGKIDPDTMYTRYFTSTGNLNKVAGYSSATLDSLFIQGKSSGSVTQRTAIYKAISAELENNAAWVWLFAPLEYRVTAKNVTGFIPLATGSLLELRKVDMN